MKGPMAIKNASISAAVTEYLDTAKGDKNALASDVRDLVEGFVTVWEQSQAMLVYNANGLFVRKGQVRFMGRVYTAPFATLEAALKSEAISTLKEISAGMLGMLNGKAEEE